MEKTIQFTKPWQDPKDGQQYEPGEVVKVPAPLALDLVDKDLAREHEQPGPTETKVDAPTETK